MSESRTWIPAGHPVVVAGYRIADGLVYVGQQLRSAMGPVEPALINPALPVGVRLPAGPPADPGQAPSYHLMSATARAGYLRWLSGGRIEADVPAGYLALFFSGLERRVLLDQPSDQAVRAELPGIAAEVRRLRSRFGVIQPRFESRAGALLEVLELLRAPARWSPGPGVAVPAVVPEAARWPVPMALRIALAQFANSGRPVPPEWARCWAWHHPSLFPTTPQTRCPAEFELLFALRYQRRLPSGLLPVVTGRPPLRVGYQPVNPGLDTVVLERPDLPDVLDDAACTRELGALLDGVTEALTPYSRWLARTPGGRGSVASTVLLPDDLLERDPGPLRPLQAWADACLAGTLTAVIDGAQFAPFWSSANPKKMSRDEAAGLAVVLGRLGLGIEPDARFGGPALALGPAVLFRLDSHAESSSVGQKPSQGYRGACQMLAIAATTVLAEVTVELDAVINRVTTALASQVALTVAERSRLGARLRWLLAVGAADQAGPAGRRPAIARVRRQAEVLTVAERDTAGDFLVRVATDLAPLDPASRDPGVSAAVVLVSALTTGYEMLGLPVEELYRRLSQSQAPALPGHHPVVVRRARPVRTNHALPRVVPEVQSDRAAVVTVAHQPGQRSGEVRLSSALIDQRLAETQAVEALLSEIFVADAAAEAASGQNAVREYAGPRDVVLSARTLPNIVLPQAVPWQDAAVLSGLDAVHRAILAELGGRVVWSRAEFTELTGRYGVLPAGAVDTLNEAALELLGESVIEGDDPLNVDGDLVREILNQIERQMTVNDK